MKLKIRKISNNQATAWVAKLEEGKPDQAILVGYYYTWQEALDKGLVALRFASASPRTVRTVWLNPSYRQQ